MKIGEHFIGREYHQVFLGNKMTLLDTHLMEAFSYLFTFKIIFSIILFRIHIFKKSLMKIQYEYIQFFIQLFNFLARALEEYTR